MLSQSETSSPLIREQNGKILNWTCNNMQILNLIESLDELFYCNLKLITHDLQHSFEPFQDNYQVLRDSEQNYYEVLTFHTLPQSRNKKHCCVRHFSSPNPSSLFRVCFVVVSNRQRCGKGGNLNSNKLISRKVYET